MAKVGRPKQNLIRTTINLTPASREYMERSAIDSDVTLTSIVEDAIAKRQFLETVANECGFIESYDAEGIKVRFIVDPLKYAAFAMTGVIKGPQQDPTTQN